MDTEIEDSFKAEMLTLMGMAHALYGESKGRGEMPNDWCFLQPTERKRPLTTSPPQSPRNDDAQKKNEKAMRDNIFKRFNLATTKPDLKEFIEAAKSEGAEESDDDFDEKVIAQQIKSLKASNAIYIKKLHRRSKLSPILLKRAVDDAYDSTYAANFDKDFMPKLIRKHIQHAVTDLQEQVRRKLERRAPYYDSKMMAELKAALKAKINAIKLGWKTITPQTRVLKEFYEHRREIFSQISKTCQGYSELNKPHASKKARHESPQDAGDSD
jgi:hypothetical protein